MYILLFACVFSCFANNDAAGLQVQNDRPKDYHYEHLQKSLGKFSPVLKTVAGQTISNQNSNGSSKSIPAKTVDWRRIVGLMIEVQCTKNTLVVLFRYNTRHARLMGDWHQVLEYVQMSFFNPQNCTERKKISNDQIMISIDMCGSPDVSDSNNQTLRRYSFTLNAYVENLWLKKFDIDRLNEYYNVSCVETSKLLDPVDFEPADFVIKNSMAQNRDSLTNFSVGDYLSFHIQLSDRDLYSPADLQTFPINCWLDDDNSTKIQRHHRYFLEHGCPAKDRLNRGLSSVSHSIDGYSTTITLKLAEYLIYPLLEAYHTMKRSLILRIKCDVVLCTNSRLNGITEIPMCPLTTYCSSLNYGKISVPKEISRSNIFLAKSARITVHGLDKMANSGKLATSRLKLQSKTQYASVDGTSTARNGDNIPLVYEVKDKVGISSTTTFFVAVISFLSGIFITAMISYSRKRYNRKSISTKFHELSENSTTTNHHNICLLPADQFSHLSPKQAVVSSKESTDWINRQF